jgi:putative CocE/NonD family hydrolase
MALRWMWLTGLGLGALILSAVPAVASDVSSASCPGPKAIANSPGAPAGSVTVAGYLPVKDGTCLRYTLLLPSVKGRFPTVLVYDTYSAGSGPLPGSPMIGSHPDAFLAAGYAVLGVNVRGTGCSQGTWDPFATEGRDGRDVVEWIAHQPWSDGRVGEIGVSDSSINALLVAEQRPPHLQAITVIATEADLYRGVAYPGGIYNHGMTTWWSLAQWQLSLIGAQAGVQEGDTACQATLVQRQHDLPLRP